MSVSRLLLEQMILYLRYGFGIMTCAVSPLFRMGVASAKLSVKLHGFPTFYAYLCNTEERKKV